MPVIRKTFTGTVSNGISSSVALNGLTSEDSVTNYSLCVEITLHFLNALYETLVEAGYEDTTVNTDEYYITIFGERIYFLNNGTGSGSGGAISRIYVRNGKSFSYFSNSSLTYSNTINYGIIIRGDENHIGIYLLTPNSINTFNSYETSLLHIFKAKNTINQTDSFLLITSFKNYDSYNKKDIASIPDYYLIKEKDKPYDVILEDIPTGFILSSNGLYKGNNSSNKVVVVPMLAIHGSYLIPSMIGCINPVFTPGKYYKIGEETYYCDNGSLFKIS